MPINPKRVSDSVIRSFNELGIDDRVGNSESHTARLVRKIVNEIMAEIINNGDVVIVSVPVVTTTGTGFANGKAKII